MKAINPTFRNPVAAKASRHVLLNCFMALVFTCSSSMAQTLIWSEEFNYTSAPDNEVWSYDLGNWGWGNAELQDYTSNTNNVWVDGSNLVITARRSGNYFSSGRIKTLDKLTLKYGTIEAQIQTPDLANGLWPAFWLLGNNFPNVSWPHCGEIDIMEMGNTNAIAAGLINRRVGSTAHWDNNGGYNYTGTIYDMPNPINGTFVIYRMEWTPLDIKTYINGNLIWTYNINPAIYPSRSAFHKPLFLILNMAVGGTYTGSSDPNSVTADFPAEYKVDWIRIYDEGDTILGGSSLVTPGDNSLVNPGFESEGLNPWIGYAAGGANEEGGYVESTNSTYYNGGNPGGDNVLTRSGEYVTKVFGDFTGGENFNGFYQDVDAASGSLWEAGGWALTHPQDLMLGSNTAWIEVSFRDPADTILSLYRSQKLTSANVTPEAWINLEVTEKLNPSTGAVIDSVATMQAPAGTAKIRYQIVFRQMIYDNGSMYFDDLNLVEQILPFALDASLVDGDFQINFSAQKGVSYEVAYKTSLTNSNWIPIETIVGDDNTNSVSYPMSNPACFYKVSTP